jgi:hypothetical protein
MAAAPPSGARSRMDMCLLQAQAKAIGIDPVKRGQLRSQRSKAIRRSPPRAATNRQSINPRSPSSWWPHRWSPVSCQARRPTAIIMSNAPGSDRGVWPGYESEHAPRHPSGGLISERMADITDGLSSRRRAP